MGVAWQQWDMGLKTEDLLKIYIWKCYPTALFMQSASSQEYLPSKLETSSLYSEEVEKL